MPQLKQTNDFLTSLMDVFSNTSSSVQDYIDNYGNAPPSPQLQAVQKEIAETVPQKGDLIESYLNNVDGMSIPQAIGYSVGGTGKAIAEVPEAISDVAEYVVDEKINPLVSGFQEGINMSGQDLNGIPPIEAFRIKQEQDLYAKGMLDKQEAVYKSMKKDPDIDQLAKKVEEIDIISIEKQLTPEQLAAARSAGDGAGDAAGDGHSIKDALKAAGGYLGDMFESKAVRNALMYYTMSRMMGYSGSGSGMAAGQVLMKGWEKEADQELKAQTLSATNAAKKLENDTLDMSKTVSMFNTKNKRVVQGYMSKSGNFQEVGSDKTYKATDLDYVTYKPALHKTYDEIDSKLLTDTNQLVASTLAGIKSNEENYSSYATAEELFANGNAVRDLISVATRDLKSAGVEYGTTEFRIAMEQTVQNHIREVASGKYEDGKSPLVADLAGIVESNYIKADLKRQGPVPQFVFEKATWDDKGNITGYDEDFKMQSGGESKLIRQANSVTNQLITNFRNKGYPAAKVNQTITKQKTIAKLAKIFQDNVMSDTASRTHWSDIAEGRGNNPFNAWLNGAKLNSDNKLNGVNSPAIRKLFDQMYDKDFEKKKK